MYTVAKRGVVVVQEALGGMSASTQAVQQSLFVVDQLLQCVCIE
jgi:hypothetical protein